MVHIKKTIAASFLRSDIVKLRGLPYSLNYQSYYDSSDWPREF